MITDLFSLRRWISMHYEDVLLNSPFILQAYKGIDSVKNNMSNLSKVLRSHNVTLRQTDKIIDSYIEYLVPPVVKSSIKKQLFTKIVCDELLDKLDPTLYEVVFPYESYDFYVKNKRTNRELKGLCHYNLFDDKLSKATRLIMNDDNDILNVIYKKVIVKSEESKVFPIMKYGVNTDRLCYLKELIDVVKRRVE